MTEYPNKFEISKLSFSDNMEIKTSNKYVAVDLLLITSSE